MKIEEKKLKKPNHEKNRLKFWKNQPVRFDFGFISLKPNRTELNPNKKKQKKNRAKTQTEKTKPNRFESVFVLKNRTETSRFEPVSVRFRFCF